jgi:hypothetical protein
MAIAARVALLGWLLVVTAMARADEPPLAPERRVVASAQKHYFAVSDPVRGRTEVFRSRPTGEPLWTIDGWHGVLFISDDAVLAVGQPGNNLLDRDFQPSDVLLRFFRGGRPVMSVEIAAVAPDTGVMRETTSHWYWGTFDGFSGGRFWVTRQDGKRFAFDPPP